MDIKKTAADQYILSMIDSKIILSGYRVNEDGIAIYRDRAFLCSIYDVSAREFIAKAKELGVPEIL